jgi:hypothetical protein
MIYMMFGINPVATLETNAASKVNPLEKNA